MSGIAPTSGVLGIATTTIRMDTAIQIRKRNAKRGAAYGNVFAWPRHTSVYAYQKMAGSLAQTTANANSGANRHIYISRNRTNLPASASLTTIHVAVLRGGRMGKSYANLRLISQHHENSGLFLLSPKPPFDAASRPPIAHCTFSCTLRNVGAAELRWRTIAW
jgi:hypothetical protein